VERLHRRKGSIVKRTLTAALGIAAASFSVSCNERPGGLGGEGPSAPLVFAEPARIVLEAESGRIEPPFELDEDGAASAGRCVTLPEKWATKQELHPAYKTRDGGRPVSAKEELGLHPKGEALVPNGSVELPFELEKAGRYAVWVRAHFANSCANSFWLGVDAGTPVDTNGDGEYDENRPHQFGSSTYGRWVWVRRRGLVLDLAEGRHVVRLFNREDGIKIDQVLLAELASGPVEEYVPQGTEKPHPPARPKQTASATESTEGTEQSASAPPSSATSVSSVAAVRRGEEP
jgi:hypothetical protein